jgi:hypothetical protein
MRLQHTNPDVTIVAIPGHDAVEADTGGGFTVPDDVADTLLASPAWRIHPDPLIETAEGGTQPALPPARKGPRSKTAPPTVVPHAIGGGTTQA